jgi:hypothetical protein
MLNLSEPLRAQLLQSIQCRRVIRRLDHSYESIIAESLPLLGLFCLQNADEPGRDDTAGKGGLVYENQHIHRVAIFTTR